MGAYDRLLDHYYANEAPLPGNVDRCCRIAGASSKAERAAVEAVLAEFFTLTEQGYSNQRATDEIAIAKPKIDAARTNGLKGGRPRKNQEETQRVSSGNPAETQSESSSSTSTKNNPLPPDGGSPPKKPKPARKSPDKPDDVTDQTWDDWLSLRASKKAPVTTTVVNGAASEASKAGMPLEAFLQVWCLRGSQGLEASWLTEAERRSVAPQTKSFRERDADAAAAVVYEMTGGRVSAKPSATLITVDSDDDIFRIG